MELVALLTSYSYLFYMKQGNENKNRLKTGTYKIVFELGTMPATFQAQAMQFRKASKLES